MNEDDSKLFQAFVEDVKPLRVEPVAERAPKTEITPGMLERRRQAQLQTDTVANFLAEAEFIARVKPLDPISVKRDGVQNGVFRNLRLGRYRCDARLDLHRMSVAQAREAVFGFISDALEADIRSALISHGKGEGREQPALLKSCVNHWLRQLEPVLAFHSARPEHGGLGACYVLMRKSERQRQENRERLGRRGQR